MEKGEVLMQRIKVEWMYKKNTKNKEAVRKFNYSFTNGVYGLLGENGAGKQH